MPRPQSPPGPDEEAAAAERAESALDRFNARRLLHEARAFLMQGRIEAAERATRRGLAFEPDDPALLRLRAHLLEQLDRPVEAERLRARADTIDPPPRPLPDTPHALDAPETLVVLLPPPELGPADRDRVPRLWPSGPVAGALVERLATRLPRARVHHAMPESAEDARRLLRATGARRVLSLRLTRSLFATTVKDGAFGLAWLDWAVAPRAADGEAATGSARRTIDALRSDDARLEAVARALEDALDDAASAVETGGADRADEAPRSTAAAQSPSDEAVAQLFPGVRDGARRQCERGRALRARGELEAARDAFAEAARLDPSDRDARALLADSEADLAIARQISGASPVRIELATQLSERERRQLESQLRDARAERARIAASLAVLAHHARAPSPATIGALSPSFDVPPPPAFPAGPCGPPPFEGAIRTLHSDGARGDVRPLARFYFLPGIEPDAGPPGATAPSPDRLCLRADDRDEDGRMDRWTGYRAGVRSDAWHDPRGGYRDRGGPPPAWERHIAYAPDGRTPLRITLRSGWPEPRIVRRLDYVDGRLAREARDTTGDGRFDTFDEFDPDAPDEGEVAVRSQDRDGDGRLDVRSVYRGGRLVRREWLAPTPPEPPTD